MKPKLVAPLPLALVAAPVFACGGRGDHGPAVEPGKEVRKDAPASKAPTGGDAAAAPAPTAP